MKKKERGRGRYRPDKFSSGCCPVIIYTIYKKVDLTESYILICKKKERKKLLSNKLREISSGNSTSSN